MRLYLPLECKTYVIKSEDTCISIENSFSGVFTEGVLELRPTLNPSRGDGYSYKPVAPPKNVKVIEKTMRNCGNWHVIKDGDICISIYMQGNIEVELFYDVNPSLKAGEDCTGSLVSGSALCIRPIYTSDIIDAGTALLPISTIAA
ncbi:hypothetical protein HYE67_011235 [Fusarium culmorum]|uniref:LysM domain-containing protein n=1 Tax=Fusarium culmorum TaxID=5516 RepID=A0A2T4GHL9_FUSCU|nr:hypothetical protein FCULG_00009236 [Fusarium culmorum]QPC69004.1 hypothetical protein HYE67_011235 [Fusarium culmorum]